MCSVTIEQTGAETTITMNRDESLKRAPEQPPRLWPHKLQEPRIIAPVDPASQGTWVGVSEGGIWACLLNGYLQETDSAILSPSSRGSLVPTLLESDQPFDFLQGADLSNTRSFRLLAGDASQVYEYFWNGKTLSKDKLASDGWLFRTSSSLKQDEVSTYRHAAFKTWLDNGAHYTDNHLPAIHTYQEPSNKEFGVLMSRDYTETKSITQIVIKQNKPAAMYYWLAKNVKQAPHITVF